MNYYFKWYWNETTGDPATDNWGTSTHYLEINESGDVLRQIEIFENGNRLKYDENNLDDEYGGLADQPVDLNEFEGFRINKEEFGDMWNDQI